MDKKVLGVMVVLLLVIGALGFWFVSNQQAGQKVTSEDVTPLRPVATPTATPEATTSGSEATKSGSSQNVKEFTVESKGLNFTPKEIKVKLGDRVKVTYKNTLGKHNWGIEELKVRTKLLDAGQMETVEFLASKKGTFTFFCSVPGHKAGGLEGMLVVE